MPNFSPKSKMHLKTLHPDLQLILNSAIKIIDFSIIEGHRSIALQKKYFHQLKSKIDGITVKGKHNYIPSMAADIMPYAKGTNAFSGKVKDTHRFYFLMGVIYVVAEALYETGEISHKVRFGLDWNRNMIFDDQTFDDTPHIELVDP
jgi:peptidoglycan L-alanyl-D-glutamate endopeptidase CwlK